MNIFLYAIQQVFIQLLKISICGISIFGILRMFQILIWQIHMLRMEKLKSPESETLKILKPEVEKGIVL